MIRAVLDTNVLASGFVGTSKDSAPVLLIDAWRNRLFSLVVSEPIILELANTLTSPYFKRHLSPELVATDVALLRTEATISPITVDIQGIATHPEDDVILATAVSTQADYLVTGDLKLQQISSYRGVKIVTPRDFQEI